MIQPWSIASGKVWQLACAVFCVAAVVGVPVALYESHGDASDTWKLVDALGRTSFFAGVPENSVFLTPNLLTAADLRDGPARVRSGGADGYLSAYFSTLAGRSVRVLQKSDDVVDLLGRGIPVYYCDHQWIPGRRTSVLLLSRLREDSQGSSPIQSDSMVVLAYRRLRDLAIEYRSSTPGPREVSPGWYEAPVAGWREEGGAFWAEVPVLGETPGTARLVDDETGVPLQGAVEIQFGRGFTPFTERTDGHYYRWNDGADGEAHFELVNSLDRAVTIRFRTSLRFNPSVKNGTVELTTPAGTETFHCDNGGVLERVWTLQPGSNPIVVKCRESRIPSPGDRRYIIFGFWDWVVAVTGPPAESPR
jgi:hypothetical protein